MCNIRGLERLYFSDLFSCSLWISPMVLGLLDDYYWLRTVQIIRIALINEFGGGNYSVESVFIPLFDLFWSFKNFLFLARRGGKNTLLQIFPYFFFCLWSSPMFYISRCHSSIRFILIFGLFHLFELSIWLFLMEFLLLKSDFILLLDIFGTLVIFHLMDIIAE